MATLASNANAIAGKWFPYYYKPFNLGRIDDGTGSTDGGIYVTQTTGTSAQLFSGSCTHSHNCAFYYELLFAADIEGGYDGWWVTKKRVSDDSTVETIYASTESGDGRYWRTRPFTGEDNASFTIDIGVNIYLLDVGEFDTGDVFKITLPTFEKMERRRIYHGGYSSFIRLPESEGVSYHSDIIPTSLQEKNITCIVNPSQGFGNITVQREGLAQAMSQEDSSGNLSLSIYLEWNVNPAGAHGAAGSNSEADYTWGSSETWLLGSILGDDLGTYTAQSEDFPAIASSPSSDVIPNDTSGNSLETVTGTTQTFNTTVSGRGGYAKIKFAYNTGTGSSPISAHNQYWQVILLIS